MAYPFNKIRYEVKPAVYQTQTISVSGVPKPVTTNVLIQSPQFAEVELASGRAPAAFYQDPTQPKIRNIRRSAATDIERDLLRQLTDPQLRMRKADFGMGDFDDARLDYGVWNFGWVSETGMSNIAPTPDFNNLPSAGGNLRGADAWKRFLDAGGGMGSAAAFEVGVNALTTSELETALRLNASGAQKVAERARLELELGRVRFYVRQRGWGREHGIEGRRRGTLLASQKEEEDSALGPIGRSTLLGFSTR